MNLINNVFKTNSFEIENDNGHTEIICPYCEKGELIFFTKKDRWVSSPTNQTSKKENHHVSTLLLSTITKYLQDLCLQAYKPFPKSLPAHVL